MFLNFYFLLFSVIFCLNLVFINNVKAEELSESECSKLLEKHKTLYNSCMRVARNISKNKQIIRYCEETIEKFINYSVADKNCLSTEYGDENGSVDNYLLETQITIQNKINTLNGELYICDLYKGLYENSIKDENNLIRYWLFTEDRINGKVDNLSIDEDCLQNIIFTYIEEKYGNCDVNKVSDYNLDCAGNNCVTNILIGCINDGIQNSCKTLLDRIYNSYNNFNSLQCSTLKLAEEQKKNRETIVRYFRE